MLTQTHILQFMRKQMSNKYKNVFLEPPIFPWTLEKLVQIQSLVKNCFQMLAVLVKAMKRFAIYYRYTVTEFTNTDLIFILT